MWIPRKWKRKYNYFLSFLKMNAIVYYRTESMVTKEAIMAMRRWRSKATDWIWVHPVLIFCLLCMETWLCVCVCVCVCVWACNWVFLTFARVRLRLCCCILLYSINLWFRVATYAFLHYDNVNNYCFEYLKYPHKALAI